MNKRYKIWTLSTTSSQASFDAGSNTVPLDLSNELAEVIRTDNMVLINRIGVDGARPITEPIFYWVNDALNPNTAVLANSGTLTATATSCVVTTGQGVRFKIGTLFRFNESNKQEVIQVTAISSDTLTIVRGYGSTSGETHADGGTMLIIANARQEGQNMTDNDAAERTASSNYSQIWQSGVNITYTRQAQNQAGVPDEYAHQVAYRLKENMRSLDNAFINGISSADAGSDTSYRSTGGLSQFVAFATSGNTRTTAAASLSESVVNQLNKDIWDDSSGVANFAVVGGALKKVVSTFDQAYRRSDFSSTAAGFTVERFLTDLGNELDIIVDPWVIDSEIFLGDLSRCYIRTFTNDAMRVEPLAKQGRSMLAQVTGQYGMEIHNGDKAFAYQNQLS